MTTHFFCPRIKCHLRVGHPQTKGHQPICRYKQPKIRKPSPAAQEIENTLHRNSKAQRTSLFALLHRYWHRLVVHTPIECAWHNSLIKHGEEGEGRKRTVIKIFPSGRLLSALLFSACIDWNAGWRESGKVITLEPIKVVSVPEMEGSSQGMSQSYPVNLREKPKLAKLVKECSGAKCAHYVVYRPCKLREYFVLLVGGQNQMWRKICKSGQ